MDQKLKRSRGIGAEDRMSGLPEQVLCSILKNLETTQVVQTSILSTRWRHIWTQVNCFHFCDFPITGPSRKYNTQERLQKNRLVNFVNRVLMIYPLPSMKRLRLHLMHQHSTSDVDSWIWSAIIRNIQELDLFSGMEGPIQLPRFLFTLKSLTILSLKSKIGINNLPESILLPSLNRLHLEDFALADDSVIVRFLSGSPTLEELVLENVRTQALCVSSSSLKRFKINNNAWYNRQEQSCRIVIDAPNLEFLELRDFHTSRIYKVEVKNLDSIANVLLHIVNLCDNAVDVLMQISSVKVLSLPLISVQVNQNLPCLKKLTQLVVTCWEKDGSNFLNILGMAPNLKLLALEKSFGRAIPRGALSDEQCVPECLKSSLERFEWESFQDIEGDMETLEFVLRNAKVLKKVRISAVFYRKKTESEKKLMEKLSRFSNINSIMVSCR
ncbi:FBD-associated F-box protein At4g10400-like [Mercurialis annua]|uniref:FBD-associated F-box protein At4g10400-like n=1 Tax=Mercurialis annua TaxID=3986 RepID=UPI00215F927F|nr:FBD-associated F-box protein At4g10400-like [Mercurialis annua]